MHYDENDPRHPHHRNRHHRHERHHPRHHEEHFQDFRSRWGEPEPLIHLNHQNRHLHDAGQQEYEKHYRHQDEEWHDPRHNRFEHQEPPIWRQQDVYFDRNNQRADNRWQEEKPHMMPPPQHPDWELRRHPRDERRDERNH
ncbi:hypothetical protein ABID22_000396 [Pontibacter aydingkolensis]|uniref:Histidine-rich glycoprotein-like n=1 Tax=Pontibacter aydingkolensis TaxID=1911536 RepID=A0ABS7CQ34_9BACT|nr:hypothetical protein [Pontibacter aydingkolensis]MBW7465940.1 hypothetical protein [Pontibacter aydingkolensis]